VRDPGESLKNKQILKTQRKTNNGQMHSNASEDLSKRILPYNVTGDKISNINPQTTRILTVQEVAGILRVHRATVSRLAMSGDLRSYLIGNRRLFKEVDVWLFFENQVDRRYVLGKEA
jgi:excisionase family DNA binding protein